MSEEKFKGIFGYLLVHWRINFLLMVGIAIAGIFAAVTLPRESTPEVKIPFSSIITVYPGASARDVEELVTDPIEKKIKNVEGVKEINSASQLGVSIVSVEFSADEDIQESVRRLREAVDAITDLPTDAEDPSVLEISFESEPILTVALGGIDDTRLLTVFADDLADEIEEIAGISDVTVVGAREEEIQVLLDPVKVASANLTIGQVIGAIRSANANIPLGQVTLDDYGYDVRIQGQFNDIGDVAAVTITTPTGAIIPLDQIATVQLTLSEYATQSRISVNGQVSTPAVTINIIKKTGGNIIDIVNAVKTRVQEVQQTTLPPEITVEAFADRGEDIRKSLNDVTDSGLQTLVIVFIVLWLFLGWRIALIAALGVPLTFAMSFLVFEAFDITLNGISLFSLIIALGLLVDNAMVLIEGIYRGVGKPNLREHAMDMVHEFQKPLIGGTLTTVAAFVPMLLVSGIIGEFLRTIPIVLTATLLSSLFVALAFIPGISVRMLQHEKIKTKERLFDRYYNKFQTAYDDFIDYMLRHRRAQNIFILSLILLLALGFSLPFTGLLKTGLFPEANVDFVIVNVELPSGATLERTSQKTRELEKILNEVPEIKSYVVNLGTAISGDFGGGGGNSENRASLFVNLHKERDRTSSEISHDLGKSFNAITGADISVLDITGGPPTSAPVEMRLLGPDFNRLAELSDEVMRDLRDIPGAIEVDRNLRFSAGEFTFMFDQNLLAKHGVSPQDAAFTLRSYLFGTEATSFLNDDNEEVKVQIKSPEKILDSISSIEAIPLRSAQGTEVRVGQVATVSLNTSINTIRRRDGERAVTITADTDGSQTANEITAQLQEKIAAKELPSGYHAEFGGEQQETQETFQDLYRSMIVAIILILIIMVIEFNSYVQPFLIFLSVPLALIGVLFGLMIFGSQLNFAAFLGLVSLTGIVVNNGIVLIDRSNSLIENGVPAFDAIKDAGNTRLRPVILSNLTSILGIVPLLFIDDQFFNDLSVALIAGQLFSTILTLVFIPILHLRLEQRKERRAAMA